MNNSERQLVLKNVIAGIATLVFAAALAVINRELLAQAQAADIMNNLQLQTIAFLGLLALLLLIDGIRGSKQGSTSDATVSEASGKVADSTESARAVSRETATVLDLLSLLQSKGRLLDFAMDDIAPYSDEQVGRVARVVHSGLNDALKDTIVIRPLHDGAEGDTVSLESPVDTERYRFIGDLTKEPPFSGQVLHRGWKAEKISLPYSSSDTRSEENIVHPVEVEVAK